jgi:hypothetical protein
VTTEPGDDRAKATGARGLLRAAHRDRERVVEVLKAVLVWRTPADRSYVSMPTGYPA